MSECPRNFSKSEMIKGLKAGRKLRVDRCDAPELQDLMDLQKEGLVDSKLVRVDDQYSYAEFFWTGPK